jgi:thioesterase domain-containing protein
VERRKYLLDRIEGVKEKLFPPAVHNAASALPELEYIGAVAARGYRPQPAPIPMVVFRPLEDPQGRFWDVQADWGKYTTARLDVHSTPGDHSTMFREPNVGALAKKVKPYLASETELGHASPDEHYARAM